MKCSKCSSKAIIYQSYSGKFLCGKHLTHSIDKRVGANIREYGMIKNRNLIGVAVSGGKDSLTMLYILHKLIHKDRGKKLYAITIDEGITGYRNKSIPYVKRLADRLGITHYVYEYAEFAKEMDKIMRLKITNPCTYCGVFRRWILNRAARELGLEVIAIGHNLDDVVQTFQLNIMRNEPLRIARFTPNGGVFEFEEFVPRIRPLFNIPEREIVAYALYNDIEFYNGECPYAHYAMRNSVREMINNLEEKHPGTKFKMLNTYLSMQNILSRYASKNSHQPNRCKECNELTSGTLCKRCELLLELSDV